MRLIDHELFEGCADRIEDWCTERFVAATRNMDDGLREKAYERFFHEIDEVGIVTSAWTVAGSREVVTAVEAMVAGGISFHIFIEDTAEAGFEFGFEGVPGMTST